MKTHKISTAWTGDMAFESVVDGHSVLVDADPEFGGKDAGPRPKALLLTALSGCTGMDVVSILGKMKSAPSWFNLVAEADLADEHPKVYTEIRLAYQFKASDGLDPKKVEKAVTLSQETYCGVSEMLRKAAKVTWTIEYL